MTTVGDIEKLLYTWAPKELAEDWDNVGLLVGDPAREVKQVLVALDITEEVVGEAVRSGVELIVAHHPVMNCAWHEVQTIRMDDLQGRKLTKLLEHRISAICMHTNLDAAQGGVNDILAQTLGLRVEGMLSEDGIGRIGVLNEEKTLAQYLPFVLKSLSCRGLRYRDGGKPVYRVAVGGGACGCYIRDALQKGCDTFVTSDLKYNDFLDTEGINLIDAGHFPTEDVICAEIVRRVAESFPDIHVQKSAAHAEVIQYYT